MKKLIYFLVVSFFAAPASQAQQGGDINLQAFRPAMDSRGFITVDATRPLGHKEISFGLVTSWGRGVLALENGGRTYQVTDIITPTLVAAAGYWFGKFPIEVGASIPFPVVAGDRGPDATGGTPGQPNDDQNFNFSGQGLGDISLSLKSRLIRQGTLGLGVAVVGSVFLPTASESKQWLGDSSPSFQGKVAIDRNFSRWRAGINAGYRYRAQGETEFRDVMSMGVAGGETPFTGQSISVGSTLPFGAALSWAVVPAHFELVGEVFGAIPLGGSGYRPLEAALGIKLYLADNSYLTLGAGTGLDRAQAANPDVRAFVGIVFEPAHRDRDGDGLTDGEDLCPDEPEDFDGFADSDGCPDDNNDGDHLLDKDDQCPNRAEDMDGFADEDGCPEENTVDSDGDGLDDDHDGCPNDPEDFDGFEDGDGCPDPNNDDDNLLDIDDLCPDLAEDMNGIDDDDGCPDRRGGAQIVGTEIEIQKKIHFEFDSSVIKEESYGILDVVAETIDSHPTLKMIEVHGHTDDRGSRTYNARLSQARADSVRVYLIDAGVSASRLRAKGFGEDKPVVRGRGERVWWQNRRVEFHIRLR